MASHNSIEIKLNGHWFEINIDGPTANSPKSDLIGHKMSTINDVPILAFEFSDPEENFFFHLNFVNSTPGQEWTSTNGIIHGKLTFLNYNQVIRSESFKLSNDESFEYKRSFIYQQGISSEMIESSVDFIYDKRIGHYEWLR